MKVLNLLIAPFLLYSTAIFANEPNSLDEYISENKKAQFSYEYQKVDAETSKLRDSWIAPVNLQYSYSKSKPYGSEQISQNAAVKISQPIFQSGGIYFGIKYAQASKIYADYSLDVAKRKLIKDAISLLMQIKQLDLNIQKQNLQIKNSEIKLEQIKEQYLNGQIDSGFLDNAVIDRNSVAQVLIDLETNKERLISKFSTISDMSYKEAVIPKLELLGEDSFLQNNMILNQSKSEIQKNRYSKNITTVKYLPRISLTAGYNWSKSERQQFSLNMQAFSEEKNYYDYGLIATMPIDINMFNDMEASKVSYLKSKAVLQDKKKELKALYEQVMQNISKYEKKKTLSVENIDIYERLLKDTQELFSAGHKTEYDIELLKNSLKIQELNLKSFEIDRQLELLTLYEMYSNEI